MSDAVSVTITRQDNYKFLVDFGAGLPASTADLAPPLGAGGGPSPEHLLSAAVANCLSASLVFAVRKFKEDPGEMTTTVVCKTGRNATNRLRVEELQVTMRLSAAADSAAHLDRALAQFEDFCTVSQSVRSGIPINLSILGADGRKLK